MDPNILIAKVMGLIVGFAVSGAVLVLTVSLFFPSTRAALASWLTGRRKDSLDSTAVSEQLTTVTAQLTSLRSEVYALRCEVAGVAALHAEKASAALPSASARSSVS